MQRLDFHAMGSRMVAVVDSEQRPAALDRVPAQFEAWEQVLSRFRNDSELCEINRRAGMAVTVSEVLWDVFQAARQADAYTGGLVNPLIMQALVSAGYDRSFEELKTGEPGPELIELLPPVPPLHKIIADSAARTLCLPSGAQLDFGGIAKGWAAQQAMLVLSEHGPALVGAGGDIAISGPRADGEPWQIAVDDPFEAGATLEDLFVAQGGVATSGRDYRRWTLAGMPQHHIIDPRNGSPAATDILTATVIAPDAMLAEAAAKALLIVGSERAREWLDGDDDLAALLILDDGRRIDSPNLTRYL